MMAIALAQLGEAVSAARLFAAVDQERDRTGLVIQPPDQPIRDAALSLARTRLGDDRKGQVSHGRAMTLVEAIDYAVAAIGPPAEA